jgi:hypothetical protein
LTGRLPILLGEVTVIAHIARGITHESDKDTYYEYLQKTGLKGYASIPGKSGCVGAAVRRRGQGRNHADFALGILGRDQSVRWTPI